VASSSATTGKHSVLAKPPTSVMAVTAWRNRVGYSRVTTVNAGSYSVIAIAAPSTTQAAYSTATLPAAAHIAMPAAPSSGPRVSTARPWPRSMAAPTEKLSAALVARPTV
jgi:hypothetical protein